MPLTVFWGNLLPERKVYFAHLYCPQHIDWAYWHIDLTPKSLISQWISPLNIHDIPNRAVCLWDDRTTERLVQLYNIWWPNIAITKSSCLIDKYMSSSCGLWQNRLSILKQRQSLYGDQHVNDSPYAVWWYEPKCVVLQPMQSWLHVDISTEHDQSWSHKYM